MFIVSSVAAPVYWTDFQFSIFTAIKLMSLLPIVKYYPLKLKHITTYVASWFDPHLLLCSMEKYMIYTTCMHGLIDNAFITCVLWAHAYLYTGKYFTYLLLQLYTIVTYTSRWFLQYSYRMDSCINFLCMYSSHDPVLVTCLIIHAPI